MVSSAVGFYHLVVVGSQDLFLKKGNICFLLSVFFTCCVERSTYQASVEMDKEERKTINKGQEDEMVTIFHNFLRSKKIKLKKNQHGLGYNLLIECPSDVLRLLV